MATKKRMSPDTSEARDSAILRTVGAFFGGRGSGSADAQDARGRTRVGQFSRDMAKRYGQMPSKSASAAPKKATPKVSAKPRNMGQASKSNPTKKAAPKTTANSFASGSKKPKTAASNFGAGSMKPKSGKKTVGGGPQKPKAGKSIIK